MKYAALMQLLALCSALSSVAFHRNGRVHRRRLSNIADRSPRLPTSVKRTTQVSRSMRPSESPSESRPTNHNRYAAQPSFPGSYIHEHADVPRLLRRGNSISALEDDNARARFVRHKFKPDGSLSPSSPTQLLVGQPPSPELQQSAQVQRRNHPEQSGAHTSAETYSPAKFWKKKSFAAALGGASLAAAGAA